MNTQTSTEVRVEEFLNGAKITDADKKFIMNHIVPKMVPADETNLIVSNPFTGWSKVVNPLVANLVYFVQDLSMNEFSPRALQKWGVPAGRKIQMFDRARYTILKIDREVYMNVVD